jgi:uncharacterized protein (TIGR00725 family)
VSRSVYVAVVGGGNALAQDIEAARRVGAELARAGAVLVCGGLGGVMEAACRGAHDHGGLTVGILPGNDRSIANPHVDVSIPTGMGEARNFLVVRSSDALVAVSGEYGTLSEIAFALATGVPVIGLSTWELSKRGETDSRVLRAESPEEAVALALERVAAAGSAN